MRTLTVAICGYGNRGSVYASGEGWFAGNMKVAAAADIRPERLALAKARHGLPEDRLFASVGDQERKYLLVVDGDAVGASTSQEALQSMLRRIILASSPDATTVNTRFVNDIEIRPTSGAGYSLMSIGEMEALLTQNKQETQTYTIRSGDTVSAIGLR